MQKEAQEEEGDKLVLHYHDVVIRQSVSCNHPKSLIALIDCP